jgi:hypothetical protein
MSVEAKGGDRPKPTEHLSHVALELDPLRSVGDNVDLTKRVINTVHSDDGEGLSFGAGGGPSGCV